MAYQSTDELYHYGVLGMKWGVRKGNYSQTVAKAKKKAGKLEKKVSKATNKKLKYANPILRTSVSDALYSKWARKSDKATSKAVNWYKKVQKVLGTESVKEIASSAGYSVGKAYLNSIVSEDD